MWKRLFRDLLRACKHYERRLRCVSISVGREWEMSRFGSLFGLRFYHCTRDGLDVSVACC